MKEREVIMIGAGGHALSLAEFAANRIAGYIANDRNPDMPAEWLGSDEIAEEFIRDGKSFHMAFVYSGWPVMKKRWELLEQYKNKGAQFVSLISPDAIVTPNSHIGEGSAVMTGAIINRAFLGENVIVNSGAIVEHDCEIGDNSFIGPGAVIGGFTKIGKNCFIGLGARLANGITIGDNISIAMGTVLNRNLKEPGIYHGLPLKRFKI